MIDILNEIKEKSIPIVSKHNKVLYNVEKVKDYGMNVIRILIDDPNTLDIDIDDVAAINQEILDVVNDLLPDDLYLEVSSVGVERELKTEKELELALNKYIYVSSYEKIENLKTKDVYGSLESYDANTITINAKEKTKTKIIKINRDKIAKIRLAVEF